jgi:hypothetical protein
VINLHYDRKWGCSPGQVLNYLARKKSKVEVDKLDDLVKSHDAIFLLLDTRESRWLPTVMAAAYQKASAFLFFFSFFFLKYGKKKCFYNVTQVTLDFKRCSLKKYGKKVAVLL